MGSFGYLMLMMMKAVLLILLSVLTLAEASYAHELPLFGALPKLSDDWQVRERETDASRFKESLQISHLVLTNSKTGDFLSFSEEKQRDAPFAKANRVPWSDMAGDRFPGGYTTRHRPKDYNPLGHWIRNEVVGISVVDTNRNTNYIEQALEYTIISEDQNGGPARLAHGYVIPMGHFRILVQHTSTNVITSDFAHSTISAMLWDYVNGANRPGAANARLAAPEAPVSDKDRQSAVGQLGKVHIDKSLEGRNSDRCRTGESKARCL